MVPKIRLRRLLLQMCQLGRHAGEVKDAPVVPIPIARWPARESLLHLTWSDPFWLYRHCVGLRSLGAQRAEQAQNHADYNTAVGKHVAVPAVKRMRPPDLHRSLAGLLREDRCCFDDVPEWIDEPGNAGVGRSEERRVGKEGRSRGSADE